MALPYPMPPVSPFDVITSQAENEKIANIEAIYNGELASSSVVVDKIDLTTFDLPSVDGWTVKQEGNHKTYTREFTYGGGGDFTSSSYTLPASLTMSGVFIDMSCYQTGTAGAYELSWTMLFSNATTFFFYRKKLGASNPGESKVVVKLTVK